MSDRKDGSETLNSPGQMSGLDFKWDPLYRAFIGGLGPWDRFSQPSVRSIEGK